MKLKTTSPINNAVHLVDPKPETRGLLMVIPRSKVVPETNRNDASDESRDTEVSLRSLKKRTLKREDSRSEEHNDDDDDDNSKERTDSIVPVVSKVIHKQMIEQFIG